MDLCLIAVSIYVATVCISTFFISINILYLFLSQTMSFTSNPWWRHDKETHYALLVLCDGDIWCFFDVSIIKLLNKHSSDWWFETPWHSSDITVMQISHWWTMKKPLEPHTGRSKLTRTSGSDPMPSFAKEVNQRLAERSIELGWFLCECLV